MEERIAPNCRRALQRVANGRAVGARKARRFLEHLAATCNVVASARAAGADPSAMYRLRKRDPAFALAWKEAMDGGYARLEEELLARALRQVTPTAFDPNGTELRLIDADREPAPNADGDATMPRPDDDGGRPAAADRAIAVVDVRLALMLLNRRRAAERTGRDRSGRRRATAEEVEQAINAKLDSLAARLAEQRG